MKNGGGLAMRLRDSAGRIINIFSVILILVAIAVTVLIFATDNRYSEPVFGDTMLLAVREGGAGAKPGSLALVDLGGNFSEGDTYATFLGNSTRITKDPLGSVGVVRGYVPALGALFDFFRNPVGFFLLVVLPLAALVIWRIVKLILIIREGGRPETEGADDD